MGLASALSLLCLLGAVEPALGGTRVLLLPPPVGAGDEVRLLSDATAQRLRESKSLVLVPEQRFRELLSGAGPEKPPADNLRTEVDASLKRVKDYYRKLALSDAIRELQALENSRLGQLACPENVNFAARISFWLGVAHAATRQPDKARERFGSALFIDPAMEIDRVYFPPAIVSLFEEVRQGLSARPKGGMSATTDPAGAQLFIDGRPEGAAPLTANLPEGDHFVCARRLGSRDWVARLHVTGGRVESQQIFLQRSQASELADQLVALLAQSGSIDFQNPAHVEAVGGTVGAEVVAAVVGPGALEYRGVGRPAVGERLTSNAPAGEAAVAADELVSRLEQRFGQATGAPPLAAIRSAPRQLEVFAAGAYSAQLGVGPSAGLGLGFQQPLAGAVSLAGRLAVATSTAVLALSSPAPAVNAQGGLLAVQCQLDVALLVEARADVYSSGSWRAYLAAGLLGRYANFGRPVVLSQPSSALVTVAPTRTFALGLLGPEVGFGVGRSLSERWQVLFALNYSAEFILGLPALEAATEGPGGARSVTSFRPQGSVRHQVSGQLGVAFRL